MTPSVPSGSKQAVPVGLPRVFWMLGAAVTLVLAGIAFWIGSAILPPRERAEDYGTLLPWFATWGLIWLTVLIAVGIAGYQAWLGMVGQSASTDVVASSRRGSDEA